MTTFVLIHGGSHGAWCWEPLCRALAARGFETAAFDLPGHGADATPRAGIRVEDYLAVAGGRIERAPPGTVTLVVHSISGVFVSDLVARHRKRVSGAIFLAAYVLAAGECQLDLVPPERRALYERVAAASPERTLFFDEAAARERFFNDLLAADAARYFPLLTPEPFCIFDWRAGVGFDALKLPVRYVIGRRDRHIPHAFCRRMAARLDVAPDYLDAGHDMMLSQPGALADLLAAGIST